MGLRSHECRGIANNVAPDSFIYFLAALLLCDGSLSITNHFCSFASSNYFDKLVVTKVLKYCPLMFSYSLAKITPLLNAMTTRKCNLFPLGKSFQPLLVNRNHSDLLLQILPLDTVASCISFRLNTNDTPSK